MNAACRNANSALMDAERVRTQRGKSAMRADGFDERHGLRGWL